MSESTVMVAGTPVGEVSERTVPVFSPDAIEFLSELSIRLLRHPLARGYPDLVSFAFWCRRANLEKLKASYPLISGAVRVGRGLALHIAPSNVPLNFAFSFAFGLLAGCSNVVRLPTRTSPQTEIVCAEINMLYADDRHWNFRRSNCLLRYGADDQVTQALSSRAAVRVIWGGDDTVNRIRQFVTPARCVDICFSDRYSLCVMGADSVVSCDDSVLQQLVSLFYNDVFLFDQNACSSPHLVVWQGDPQSISHAKDRFWCALKTVVEKRYEMPSVSSVEKLTQLFRTAVNFPGARANLHFGIPLITVHVDELPSTIESFRGSRGFFLETVDNDLDKLMKVVTSRFQTVTYFGLDPCVIQRKVVSSGVGGVDRIVPVGKALEIGLVWDGYDVIGSMSRIISQV